MIENINHTLNRSMPNENDGYTLPLNPEDKGPPIVCQSEGTELEILHHDEDPHIEPAPEDGSGSEQRKSSAEGR